LSRGELTIFSNKGFGVPGWTYISGVAISSFVDGRYLKMLEDHSCEGFCFECCKILRRGRIRMCLVQNMEV
jgi:hypothetical protein